MAFMKRFLFLVSIFGAVLSGAGCSEEDDNTLPQQQRQILSFLTGTLGLRTQEEAEDPSSEVENAPFYTTTGNTAYRWITNYYDADRGQRAEVVYGSTVTLTLSVYEFDYRKISDRSVPLYTNDESKRTVLTDAGLNPEYWSFAPYTIQLGTTRTIKGLESSLAGCRQGDIVELYMTYTMAYGDDWLYAVEQQSPLAIHFTVDRVE